MSIKEDSKKFFLKSKIIILNSIYASMMVAQDNIQFIKSSFEPKYFIYVSIVVALLNVYFRFGTEEKIYIKKDKTNESN